MDLLSALPEDIFNEVISYLTSKDIRKGSLVCKSWYQMFGQSNECLQKIVIRYSDYNCKNDLNALIKSDRKYQNLIIRFENSRIKDSGVEANIRAILKKFSKSIVKLQTSHDFQRICELPKLKELVFNQSTRHYQNKNKSYCCSNGLFATCLNVTKLDIICSGADVKFLKILQEAIKNMRNLKVLALEKVGFLKNVGPEDCKFRLEQFQSRSFCIMTDISDFLKLHQSTLKVVKVSTLNSKDIPLIFLEFPKLHTLYFNDIYFPRDQKLEIAENSTIKHLHIRYSIN
jgi:hypothetical protein